MTIRLARWFLVGFALSLAGRVDALAAASESAVPVPGSVLIAEAFHLVETLGDGVWPGFARTNAPVLYVVGEREYAIGFPRPLSGFEAMAGTTVAGRSVQVAPRTHAPDLGAGSEVQGVPAVVIGTPEANGWSPTQWALKASHEMFHVFQGLHGLKDKVATLEIGPRDDAASWQLVFPFPYEDPDVARLLHLASYPTFLAIEASSDEDVAYNAGVAADALAVLKRVLLAKTGDERAQRYMLFQEATEGGAKYVEHRMAQRAATGYEPTAEFVSLPRAAAYADVWKTDYAGQKFLVKHAGRVTKSRTEFYHLGLGKCLLLDRLDPMWKQRYFDPGAWLPDLVDAAVRAQQGRTSRAGARGACGLRSSRAI